MFVGACLFKSSLNVLRKYWYSILLKSYFNISFSSSALNSSSGVYTIGVCYFWFWLRKMLFQICVFTVSKLCVYAFFRAILVLAIVRYFLFFLGIKTKLFKLRTKFKMKQVKFLRSKCRPKCRPKCRSKCRLSSKPVQRNCLYFFKILKQCAL